MATGLFDYFSELNPTAWLDLEELPVVWFDKDLIETPAAATSSLPHELVVLQSVNRAGAF